MVLLEIINKGAITMDQSHFNTIEPSRLEKCSISTCNLRKIKFEFNKLNRYNRYRC